jgi:penicillin-binding protein 1A
MSYRYGKKGRGQPLRKASPTSRVAKYFKRFVLVVFFFCFGCAAGLALVFYYFSLGLPAIGPLLEGYDPPQTTTILAADGTVIGELFVERRTVVPIDRIPDIMVNAVIAAEDADFRTHEGLDYPGMVRAMFTNVTSGRLAQGASTITQQVARTFFLTRKKQFSRKIREILLTKRIEERLTKDEILYLYLNQINFGHARYGVAEACAYYFNKDIEEITVTQAALLASIPKGPSIYEPIGHPDAARNRREYVLGEMARRGFISRAQADLGKVAPLGLVSKGRRDAGLAPEVISWALKELEDIVDLEALEHGGYVIETGLDPGLQRAAREAVKEGLRQVDERHGRQAPFKKKRWPKGDRGQTGELKTDHVYLAKVIGPADSGGAVDLDLGGRRGVLDMTQAARYNPDELPASQFAVKGAVIHVSLVAPAREEQPLELRMEEGPQAALVVIEPHTGRIVVLVGGDNVKPGGFDRATAAMRQPGSAFKPFVYLQALRSRKYTVASMLDDSPETEGDWKPRNSHGDSFEGAVPMRAALARSLNLPAVKLIRDVGPDRVNELASSMGIDSRLEPGPALALGSSSVTPLEMASAYAVLAAGGMRHKPWIVRRVVGPNGKELPMIGRQGARVLAPEEAYLMTSLLESVIDSGTGRKARALGRSAAGKTGTSNDAKDAWFVGYTPDMVAAAWVGFDEPRSLGRKEYGGRAALPIWLDFMKVAHAGRPKTDFEEPPGLVRAMIDPSSGLLAYEDMEGAVEEIFIDGTQPTETALPPDMVSLEGFLLEQIAGEGPGEADGGLWRGTTGRDGGAR